MRVIAGSAKGRHLKTPRGRTLRPTSDKVKAAFFNVVGSLLPDSFFLDLFAGTGSIGIEAMSRGAKRCVFVEKDVAAVKLIKKNIQLIEDNPSCSIFHNDIKKAIKILSQQNESFSIIYIDPPYDYRDVGSVVEKVHEGALLRENGLLCVERSSRDVLLWVKFLTLPLWQKKIYGDTSLLLFKK